MITLRWFLDNGCELQRPDPKMLTYIWQATNGDPCKDCNCKSTCPAWPKVRVERVRTPVRQPQ